MKSLKGLSIECLFRETPDKDILDQLSNLLLKIDHNIFLNHTITKTHLKRNICDMIGKLQREANQSRLHPFITDKDVEYIQYLFINTKFDYEQLLMFNDLDTLIYLVVYLKPTKWKTYKRKNNKLIVRESPIIIVDGWLPFDFERDIINSRISCETVHINHIRGNKILCEIWYKYCKFRI